MQAYARRLQAHIVGKSGARSGSQWLPDLVNRMGSPLSITIAFGMRHYARIASTALSARPGLRAAREAAPAHAPVPQRTSPRRSGTPAGRPLRRPHRTSSSPAAPAGWGEGQAAVMSLRHSRRDAHPFPALWVRQVLPTVPGPVKAATMLGPHPRSSTQYPEAPDTPAHHCSKKAAKAAMHATLDMRMHTGMRAHSSGSCTLP